MITTSNYFELTKNIDWSAVPGALKKTHDTLIPDASRSDWKAFSTDEDVRRVVEKYFGYIGKYVSPSDSMKGKAAKASRAGVAEAREVAISLIRSYVLRGDSLESIRQSWLGRSDDTGSAQVKGNKILVDKVAGQAVNFSFSLSALYSEIKGETDHETSKSKSTKKSSTAPRKPRAPKAAGEARKQKKLADSLPEATQVTFIPTATAFIKRYAALHGKVKTRDQILSLCHGLQKAITEQKIKTGNPALAEIEKMQSELITLATSMGESAKIEIDATSLSHYKQIAQGEEVRTSVKLLKSFIAMTGKAYDLNKATALLTRMTDGIAVIPKVDPYLSQLSTAADELTAYVNGKKEVVGIPKASLHGLGSVAIGLGALGLGTTSGEGAIVRLLREKEVKTLSDAALEKAFSQTAAPGLCLALAQSLIRSGELSLAKLQSPSKKKSGSLNGNGLGEIGLASDEIPSGRISDIDILEMRLQNSQRSSAVSGLGNMGEISTASRTVSKASSEPLPVSKASSGQIMTASALKTMKFPTIGLTGKWKDLIGDPAPAFSAMVYGLPKQGKSTFCLRLANDLAKLGSVLYCALEEGFGATLSEKLHRLGIAANALQFGNHLPRELSKYKFVFIDSVSEAGLDADGLREMRKANPGTAFIFVYHSTKAGNFRGSNTDAHDVDIIVEVKDGMANARGRYAPPAEMPI